MEGRKKVRENPPAKRWNHRRKNSALLFSMLLPGCLYLLLNNYLPMAGIIVAFKDYNPLKGIWGSSFCGLKNFEFLFKTSDIFYVMRNTVLYNAAFLILTTFCGILLAILLSGVKNRYAVRFLQTVYLLPTVVSTVILTYMVLTMLDEKSGFFNCTLLPAMGIHPAAWYSEPKYWVILLPLLNLWCNIGQTSIIYYASLIGFDKTYYEAAAMDGASRFQQAVYITVPLLKKTIALMVVLALGRLFTSNFGLFYQIPMDSGALYSTTNVLDTYVYRGLIKLNDIGMASAAGLLQSLLGFVLVVAANRGLQKLSPENSIF